MILDEEIAEAKAQIEALRVKAQTDPVAALVLKRIKEAEKQFLQQWAEGHFDRPFNASGAAGLCG